MKKLLTLLVSFMLALTLVACTSTSVFDYSNGDVVDSGAVRVSLGTEELDTAAFETLLEGYEYTSIEINEEKSNYDLSVVGEHTIVLILTAEDGETTEVALTLVVFEEVATEVSEKLYSKENTLSAVESLAEGDLSTLINENASSSTSSNRNTSSSSTTSIAALQKAVDDAQAVIDKGSLGFFETYGYTEAVKYLKNSNSWTTSSYYSYTKLGATNDATSLANMKTAIEMIIYGNTLRKAENVSNLKISSYLMAIAQVNTNASAYTLNHTYQGNVGENLAWGYTGYAGPYYGWYTIEKKVYNWLSTTGGYTITYSNYSEIMNDLTNEEITTIVRECGLSSSHFVQVGHYLNLTYSQYTVTGGAYNRYGSYGTTHGQTFYYSATDAIDASTYYSNFMAYYNKVYQDLADAQAALEAATR